ncbi:serine/threonine-protein kinase [Actinomadura rifamycini]|uniref:serine/threonine-protein kinase n=1 Tax=Actinomadura rifamycini TaxID=31962 RepID=UPI000686E476|nr:serine/threonine-protein kinase [Actinomadura rifamycini]
MPHGRSLPGYVEVAKLGEGAQGRVVLARHESGGVPVAVKYLATELLTDAAAKDTFRSEAEALRRVADEHVARLFYFVEWQDGAAIIMEAVPGRSLRRVLDERDAPLQPEAALTALKGSLLGLAAAHEAGVVHRDYKPANVLVQDNGRSKLIDFGIAVLTGQGDKSGTPAYMAPEQWNGDPATPATDLYAATCVFVECITGRKPFEATTIDELRTKHISTRPPLDRVPKELHRLVERGMAKNPSERMWSAVEFVRELEETAARAYGPEWERRGLIALGALAALVGTAVPLAMFSTALLAPGVSGLGAGSGAAASGVAGQAVSGTGYVQGAATADVVTKAAGSTSKGFLSKLGGGKGVAGIGTAGAGAVVAGWLFWPSPPDAGGVSHGAVHGYFTKPGVLVGSPNMPASETPWMDLKLSATPARAEPGSRVKFILHFRARTPWGGVYLPNGQRQCYGENSNRPDVEREYSFGFGGGYVAHDQNEKSAILALYPSPPAHRDDPPKDANAIILRASRKMTGEAQPYVMAQCAFMSRWTETRIVTLPGPKTLPPGKYLVAPAVPPRLGETFLEGEPISPESAGAITEGRLPVLEVLEDS